MSSDESGTSPIRAAARSISEKDHSAFLAEAADRLKFQVEFAQSALRNLLLVNGGAVLALLTALGNSQMNPDARGLWWAFSWFGIGLASSLIAFFAAFFSQYFFYNGTVLQAWNAQREVHELPPAHDAMPQFLLGDRFLVVGVICAVVSLVAFIVGSFVALEALIRV